MQYFDMFNALYEQTVKAIEEKSKNLSSKLQYFLNTKFKEIWNLILVYKMHEIDNERELEWALQKIESKLNDIEKQVNKVVREEYLKDLSILIPVTIALCYVFGYQYTGDKVFKTYRVQLKNLLTTTDINKTIKAIKQNKLSKDFIGEAHLEAIKILQKQTFGHILGANFKMGERTKNEIRNIIKEEILKGYGQNPTDIANKIAKRIEEKGIKSIDSIKRNFEPQFYANMVVSTEMSKAFNTAIRNRLVENSMYYVRVVNTKGPCDKCKPYNKKIYCIAPKNKPELNPLNRPYLEDCKGLFHVYCRCVNEPVKADTQ